jgi:hypothetical protein
VRRLAAAFANKDLVAHLMDLGSRAQHAALPLDKIATTVGAATS